MIEMGARPNICHGSAGSSRSTRSRACHATITTTCAPTPSTRPTSVARCCTAAVSAIDIGFAGLGGGRGALRGAKAGGTFKAGARYLPGRAMGRAWQRYSLAMRAGSFRGGAAHVAKRTGSVAWTANGCR